MTLIPELERSLGEMARSRRRRRRWPFAVVPVALVLSTTGALAATGVIPIGSPATDPAAPYRKPNRGDGVLVPGTDRLLRVVTRDPDGGPPWGMRVVRTTRGLGCLQVGRIVDGQLGVLGRDGAFGNDRRLHPFKADSVGQFCGPLDANGRLFANWTSFLVAASASPNGECFPRPSTRGVPESRYCDNGSLRNLHFGLLGPEAVSVSVGGRSVKLAEPEGAYLLVSRPPADLRFGGSSSAGPYPMNGPITAIHYRDGSSCATSARGPVTDCPVPGYVAPARVIPKDLSSEVTVSRPVRRGTHWRVTVSFTARAPVTEATSQYVVRLLPLPGENRFTASMTDRNIAAGETVSQPLEFLKPGLYRGVVSFQAPGNPKSQWGKTVGRFSVRVG